MGAIEWVTEEDSYACPLPKETQQIAKEELREDRNTRDQALEQIRNWIKLNPRIQNCRLGERMTFILRNISFALFYVPAACKCPTPKVSCFQLINILLCFVRCTIYIEILEM